MLVEPQMQTRSCSLEAPYYGHRSNGLTLLACLVVLQIHERNSLTSKYLHIRFKLSSNMCVYKRPVLTMRFQALRFEYLLSDLHFCKKKKMWNFFRWLLRFCFFFLLQLKNDKNYSNDPLARCCKFAEDRNRSQKAAKRCSFPSWAGCQCREQGETDFF